MPDVSDFKIKRRPALTCLIVLAFVLLVPISKLRAATITVNEGTSALAVDSLCSLREAIQNANDNAATNADCVAGSGTDTIDLQTNVSLDIVDHTSSADFAVPAITDALIINGNSHSIVRSGVTSFGLADFFAAVSLSDIDVSNFSQIVLKGDGALSIDNSTFSGNLDAVAYTAFSGSAFTWTVTNSTFENNSSSNYGVLTKEDGGMFSIDNSTFSGNVKSINGDGSAVRYLNGNSSETLSITDSTFINNSFSVGGCGAVGVSSSLDLNIEITNTTFDSNISEFCGGALSIESGFAFATIALNIEGSLFKENAATGTTDKSGGAIYVQNGMAMTLTNNTFYGNTSKIHGGAIQVFNESGVVSIQARYNTFYNNTSVDGAGNDIYVETGAGDTSVFENNIFASGGDECGGDLTSFTFTNNLSGDSDCGPVHSADHLEALSDNGGPTKTIGLASTSNAVDAGIAGTLGCPATDQRGETRPKGSACDIGAYEREASQQSSGGGGGGGGSSSSGPGDQSSETTDDETDAPVDNTQAPDDTIVPDDGVKDEPKEDAKDEADTKNDDLPADENTNENQAPVIDQTPDEPAVFQPAVSPIQKLSDEALMAAKFVSDVVQKIPQKAADAVSAAGVAVPAIVAVVTQPAVAANVVSIPIRLWNLIPIWLGFRRKKRPWGTVYDSVTKQPLDPVYVSLRDIDGKEIASTVTDIDGRFGFLVPPGRYKITARKDNYKFPSEKLSGSAKDELYDNLYFNGEIEITGGEDLVIRNIPMDSTDFNWNEFEKANNKSLMRFYSKRELFFARFANILFWVGLIISTALLFGQPTKLNYILFGVYFFVLILRSLGIKPKKPGYITEAQTGYPLSFGIVKIFSSALNKEIAHAIISKTGKYYVLVPNGNYYMTVEKKIGEDSYTEVYRSEGFRTRKGYIGKILKI